MGDAEQHPPKAPELARPIHGYLELKGHAIHVNCHYVDAILRRVEIDPEFKEEDCATHVDHKLNVTIAKARFRRAGWLYTLHGQRPKLSCLRGLRNFLGKLPV